MIKKLKNKISNMFSGNKAKASNKPDAAESTEKPAVARKKTPNKRGTAATSAQPAGKKKRVRKKRSNNNNTGSTEKQTGSKTKVTKKRADGTANPPRKKRAGGKKASQRNDEHRRGDRRKDDHRKDDRRKQKGNKAKARGGNAPRDPEAKMEAARYENPVASRTLILETITQHGALTQESLFEKLAVKPDQEEGVSRRLGAMVRDGQLVQNRRGGYLPVDEKHFVRGHVMAHADGFGFLIPEEGGDDLFLSAKQMRSVMHGDRVVATVSGVDRRGRLEGAIISVIERVNKTLIGRLFIEEGIALVVPDNKRITHNILIPADMIGEATEGQIVKVEITKQPGKRTEPIGKVVGIIGEHMAPGMEIEVAIHNYGIPNEFPVEAVAQADACGDSVRDDDKKGRVDLRERMMVTIDGEDARDFDDAVHSEPREDEKGNLLGWKLTVAIADVAHYVDIGSELDKEAYERATSVYFPGRVVPMLPESLSNGLCSINPDVDRLCMACEIIIDTQGEVESYTFMEAVMRSHKRLTYTRVAQQLEAETIDDDMTEVYPHLVNLYQMFRAMEQARKNRGTIEFDTTETVIHFTDDQRIDSIRPSVSNVAHKIIEECMIAANVCAAKFVAKHKIPSLYRVHDDPADEKIEDLRGVLGDLELKLGEPQRKISSKDFAVLSEDIKGREDYHMLQTLMLRSMKQAIYKAENDGHFGLALTHYTHFTSPIRRYPDLLIHRAIKHLLRKRKMTEYEYTQHMMVNFGEHCSNNERRANEATRDAEFALKCEYMLDKIGKEYHAHVSSVVPFGLFVELEEHYVEGLIHITSLPKDYYVYDPRAHVLVGENRGLRYALNDKLKIRVNRVDMDERKIDFELID